MKSTTMLEQLLEEINFQRTKEMRQLMKDGECSIAFLCRPGCSAFRHAALAGNDMKKLVRVNEAQPILYINTYKSCVGVIMLECNTVERHILFGSLGFQKLYRKEFPILIIFILELLSHYKC